MKLPRICLLSLTLSLTNACGSQAQKPADSELDVDRWDGTTELIEDTSLSFELTAPSEFKASRSTTSQGSTSRNDLSVLHNQDQSGTQNDNAKYRTFKPSNGRYLGVLFFKTSSVPAQPTSLKILLNASASEGRLDSCQLSARDFEKKTWVVVSSQCPAKSWQAMEIQLPSPVKRFYSSDNELRIRLDVKGAASLRLDSIKGQLSGETVVTPPPETPPPTEPTPEPNPTPEPPPTLPVPSDESRPFPIPPSLRTLTVGSSGANYTSIQAAINAAVPGDRILIKAGTYKENLVLSKSGAADKFIILEGESGAILDGTGKSPIGISISGGSSYVRYLQIKGLTIQNFQGSSDTPMAIHVKGRVSHLDIRNNLIQRIVSQDNAHGILVSGTTQDPISQLVIEGNEIRNMQLGASENLVVNGNVTDWIISKNSVHDTNNIAIDAIGYEGTCSGCGELDRARNGIIRNNNVYNVSSYGNPAYGTDRSAGGIYVDGGKNILIEGNRIDNCDIGIEVASEHAGKTTDAITIRNNFVSRSFQGNIQMGGYDAKRGKATNIVVVHNTTFGAKGGELVVQFMSSNVTIKNNIFVASSGALYLNQWGSSNTAFTIENNIYFGASTSSTGDFKDNKPIFKNPLLKNGANDLHLLSGSPAIDAASDLGQLSGAFDIDLAPRVRGASADIGADEI